MHLTRLLIIPKSFEIVVDYAIPTIPILPAHILTLGKWPCITLRGKEIYLPRWLLRVSATIYLFVHFYFVLQLSPLPNVCLFLWPWVWPLCMVPLINWVMFVWPLFNFWHRSPYLPWLECECGPCWYVDCYLYMSTCFGHHRYLRQFVIPTSVVCSVIFGLWWDHVNLTPSSNLFLSLSPGGIALLVGYFTPPIGVAPLGTLRVSKPDSPLNVTCKPRSLYESPIRRVVYLTDSTSPQANLSSLHNL